MKIFSILILSAILICDANTVTYADVINIPDDFETIQEGIDEAEDGDTVLVAPGEYVENILISETPVTLASYYLTTNNENYIDSTIIDGDHSGSVIRIVIAEEDEEFSELTNVIGFTLTNGSGSNDLDDDNAGGGIHCLNSSPTLRYLKITGNEANYGGGVFFQLSSPLVEYCEISDNHAGRNGGGIYISRDDSEPFFVFSLIRLHA